MIRRRLVLLCRSTSVTSVSIACRSNSSNSTGVPSIRDADDASTSALIAVGDQRRFASLVFANDATLRATPVSERVLLNADRAAAASGGLTHVEVAVDEVRVEFQLASSPTFRRWASLFVEAERGELPADAFALQLVPKQVFNRTSWGAGATVIFGRKQMQSHLTKALALLSSSTMSTAAAAAAAATPNDVQQRLRLRWFSFMSTRLSLDNDDDKRACDEWFETVARRYNEAHRAYHTLTHIDSMLTRMDSLDRESDAIELATWFHDAVYDPTRSDNEERSAEMFDEFARRFSLSEELTTRVRRFVLATTKHRLDGDLATDVDAQLFLDLDLSILAASQAEYDAYARGIRHEYAHVPREAYLQGRPQVLRSLTSKAVFVSDWFHTDALESAAKANVEREVTALEGGEFL
jgi:predicted metal-dependent HD superfamily phosphohydrolase